MWRSASTVRSTFVLMMVFLLPLVTGSVRGTAEGKNSKMNIAAPLNEIDLENAKLIRMFDIHYMETYLYL